MTVTILGNGYCHDQHGLLHTGRGLANETIVDTQINPHPVVKKYTLIWFFGVRTDPDNRFELNVFLNHFL